MWGFSIKIIFKNSIINSFSFNFNLVLFKIYINFIHICFVVHNLYFYIFNKFIKDFKKISKKYYFKENKKTREKRNINNEKYKCKDKGT